MLMALATSLLSACEAPAADSDHAVVLLYHHVSASTPRSTSVTPATFENHLDLLEERGYTVMPLADVVEALSGDGELPPGAVALTFDDAYRSVYDTALPMLERRGWPFTVFVATEAVDRGYANFMSWDDLRDLERRGGTVANHGTAHAHLVRRLQGESAREWASRVRDDITGAMRRLEEELDEPLRLFAYPYGEFDRDLETLVADLGYVAFGQQSGPAGHASPLTQLPRFPVAEAYADVDDLVEKLRTRPLPVTVLRPDSRVLQPGGPAPELMLRVPDGPYRRADMRCYVAGQPPAAIDWDGGVATIRASRALGAGRSKYNCTAPSSTDDSIFHWYSHLWIAPEPDGSWYDE